MKIKSTNVAITKKKIGDCHVKINKNSFTKTMTYVLMASSDLDVQQEVLAKFIDFEPLKSHLPPYILHAKETKV